MSNDYFNLTSPLSRHTLGRAEAVNAIFQAVASGFGKLPDVDDIVRGRVTFAVDTGTANALVVAMPKAMTAYENGSSIWVEVAATNTGAATINVDGLGARSIKLPDGTDPATGDLTAGDIVQLVYDASALRWILSTPYRLLTLVNDLRGVIIGSFPNDAAANASGLPISEGTIYFKNTATKGLRLYQDGAWINAAVDTNGALIADQNLSDLFSVNDARSNLEVYDWAIKTTTYTAKAREKVAADVSGGAWTLTLPASPATGDWVQVAVIGGDPAVNNLTIDGGAADVQGDGTLVVDTLFYPALLIFSGTEWRLA